MTIPLRVYGLLLKFFPARFREEYGKPLEMQFRDEYCEADRLCSRIAFWVRTLWDLVRSIPAELLREARQDIRYSLTTFQRRPMVTVFALAALSLGIGATTALFSIVNGVLLRPLPYSEPDRLVSLSHSIVVPGVTHVDQSDATFLLYQRHNRVFDGIGSYRDDEVNLAPTSGDGTAAERVSAAGVSASLLSVLRATPLRGRVFLAGEDRKAAPGLVLLSERIWRQKFSADPAVVGANVLVDGVGNGNLARNRQVAGVR